MAILVQNKGGPYLADPNAVDAGFEKHKRFPQGSLSAIKVCVTTGFTTVFSKTTALKRQ